MELLTALALAAITIAVPQRANAHVSAAADGRFVAIAWAASTPAGTTDIYAAVSADDGRSFGAPVQVNDVPGDARVNGEQPPRLSLVPHAGRAPGLVVVWTTKGAAGTKLVQARSDDGGRTFAPAMTVPGSDAPGNRGWESAAVDHRGGIDALWLDHRELAQGDAQMAMAHHATQAARPDGVAMAQRSKLYFASLDGSVAPHAITGGVCYCCKTAIAPGAGRALYAAWRQVYPGNIRDIAFTLSRDGGRTFAAPIRVSEDKWVLEGCPDDGPTMAVDRQQRIHIVWPTLVNESGQDGGPNLALFHAVSQDGRSFSPRERLPTEGTPHHPQAAIDAAGHLVVTWDELQNGARHVAMARATGGPDHPTRFVRAIVSGADPGIYPVVASASDGLVVAWTSGGAPDSVIRLARVP
jgi:hypothetical protein